MKEALIEHYLVTRVAKHGGEAEKFVSPQKKNVPDRIVWWTMGDVDFVELKATGEAPNEGQLRDHKRRRARGFRVFVFDSFAAIDWYIQKGRELSILEYQKLVSDGHTWVVGNG